MKSSRNPLYVNSTPINIFVVIVFLIILSSAYTFLTPRDIKINHYWYKNLVDYQSNSLSDSSFSTIMMTVDSLVTTSTFAFVAISSISPSSSGSSVVINRLSWKGLLIFRYPFLLISTSAISLINIFAYIYSFKVMMLFGIVMSFIILISVVFKYTFFHRRSHTSSSIMFNSILKKSLKGDMGKVSYDKSLWRLYLNPLKGSRNVDLIKSMLLAHNSIFSFIEAKKYQRNKSAFDVTSSKDNASNCRMINSKKITSHFFKIFQENGVITHSLKMAILADVVIKVEEVWKLSDKENEKRGDKKTKKLLTDKNKNEFMWWLIKEAGCNVNKFCEVSKPKTSYLKLDLLKQLEAIYVDHKISDNIG